jgi:hypothetical protein
VTSLLAKNGISQARTFVKQFEKRWGRKAAEPEVADIKESIQRKLAELERPVRASEERAPETGDGRDDASDGEAEGVTEEKADTLEGLGWRISRGTWRMTGGVLEGALDGNGDAAILQRAFKSCDEVSVELKGTGDAAGFSFGEGKRFLVRPTHEWQTVKLEIPANGMPSLSLNGDSRTSLEDVSKADASMLGETLSLCLLGGKVQFRNFKMK